MPEITTFCQRFLPLFVTYLTPFYPDELNPSGDTGLQAFILGINL